MAARERSAFCSFCGKDQAEVGTLVAGPGVYICDGCVALCGQLLAGRPASNGPAPETVARVTPWDAEAGLDPVLASLPRVARAGEQAQYALAQYVRRARQLGATWAAIGAALGVTRQSAWERFSGPR